jgi:glycosyltransferase involved in cell wall biosynthesis
MFNNSAVISCSPLNTGLGVYSRLLYDLDLFDKLVFFKKSSGSDESGYLDIVKPKPEVYPLRVFFSAHGRSFWKTSIEKFERVHLTSPEFFHLVRYNRNMTGTVHDLQPIGDGISRSAYTYAFRKYMQRNYDAMEMLQGIVTISRVTEKVVRENFPFLNPVTIHQWTDGSFIRRGRVEARKTLNLDSRKKILLNVSSAEPRKNLKILPEILKLLPEEYIILHIGSTERSITGNRRIINIASVPEKDYPLYFNASDLLLSPSLQEGFGRPTIEAVNSGVPVVLSDIPVNREILPQYGYFADAMSAEDYAEKIERIMGLNESQRDGLYSGTGDYYREGRAVSEYRKFFDRVCGGNST